MYTDSHAHLPGVAESLGLAALQDLLAAYEKAWEGEPRPDAKPLLVDIGTEAGDFPSRMALLGRRPFLRYSLGVWPGAEALADVGASLAGLAASLEAAGGEAAAIGECGLDYHHMEAGRETQLALFRGQVELAAAKGLPLIVHSRDAFDDTVAVIKEASARVPVLIHCFGYGPLEAGAFLALGCHISFAGNLTYKKAEVLRAALVLVPTDRLLLETDAPYMNPDPMRGKPSSPLDVARTYAFAAALRAESPEALSLSVAANASRLFG